MMLFVKNIEGNHPPWICGIIWLQGTVYLERLPQLLELHADGTTYLWLAREHEFASLDNIFLAAGSSQKRPFSSTSSSMVSTGSMSRSKSQRSGSAGVQASPSRHLQRLAEAKDEQNLQKYRIFVVDSAGKTFTMRVKSSTSIAQLKEKLTRRGGVASLSLSSCSAFLSWSSKLNA